MENLDNKINIIVIKRNGKKVDFDGTKIAIAIKKGFDSILVEGQNKKYTDKDINKVFLAVLKNIEEFQKQNDRIKIEEIQDLIEDELKSQKYIDVYKSFSVYRENRKKSREVFLNEKKQHKFIKVIENLGLQSRNDADFIEHNNPENMLKVYGSAVSEEFTKAYLIREKYSEAHEEGDFFIHYLDYIPTGATANIGLDLEKIFREGYKISGVKVREPQSIMSYALQTTMAIKAARKEQSGEQILPAFDYFLSQGVLKSFKKQFRMEVFSLLEFTEFDKFVATNGIEREIDRIESIDLDIKIFFQYLRESEQLQRLLVGAYKRALQATDKLTYQALEAFLHNVNILDNETKQVTTVNFGTDTSAEGRMIIKNLLEVFEKGIGDFTQTDLPYLVFKIKEGINLYEEDKNHDMLEKAYLLLEKGYNISFVILDAKHNRKLYIKDDFSTETVTSNLRHRVIDNIIDPKKATSFGRGNIAIVTINLPRLGIKNMNFKETKEFFNDLEKIMLLAKDHLLERFEIQCEKRKSLYPFLLEENVWLDADRLKEEDRLRRALKQGNFSIGFVGLDECVKALTGKKQGESEESQKLAQKIIKIMRNICDEFSEEENLNFTLLATKDEIVGKTFLQLDRAIYGKIDGITDKKYTDSFFAGNNLPLTEKIKIESNYHALCNGGHELVLNKSEVKTKKSFLRIISELIEYNIGYVSFK